MRKWINKSLRFITTAFGIVAVGLAFFLAFGITVYSLKEQDEGGFLYLIIPLLFLIGGFLAIWTGSKRKSEN